MNLFTRTPKICASILIIYAITINLFTGIPKSYAYILRVSIWTPKTNDTIFICVLLSS